MIDFAFTAIVVGGRELEPFQFDQPGFGIGLAQRGVAGYVPQPIQGRFETWERAMDRSKTLNREAGLSDREAVETVLSSMAASWARALGRI